MREPPRPDGHERPEEGLFEQAQLQQAAHDLNTPLTVISGYAQLLLMSNPREDQVEALDALQMAATNLRATIGDLLTSTLRRLGPEVPHAAITALTSGAGAPSVSTADVEEVAHSNALAEVVAGDDPGDEATLIGEPFLLAMVERQREALAGLRRDADTDYLTGIGNRRALDHMLAMEWHRAERHQRLLSILIVDIDGVKMINDSWGHPCGDLVIAEVARRLVARVRSEDEVGRIGGDEFMVVSPESDAASARIIARKLTRAVAAKPIATPAGLVRVRLSAGWASTATPYTSVEELVAAADARLYAVKARHRRPPLIEPVTVAPA